MLGMKKFSLKMRPICVFPLTLKRSQIILNDRKIKRLVQVLGEVAQSVERETENLCVGGSIPSLATSPQL